MEVIESLSTNSESTKKLKLDLTLSDLNDGPTETLL